MKAPADALDAAVMWMPPHPALDAVEIWMTFPPPVGAAGRKTSILLEDAARNHLEDLAGVGAASTKQTEESARRGGVPSGKTPETLPQAADPVNAEKGKRHNAVRDAVEWKPRKMDILNAADAVVPVIAEKKMMCPPAEHGQQNDLAGLPADVAETSPMIWMDGHHVGADPPAEWTMPETTCVEDAPDAEAPHEDVARTCPKGESAREPGEAAVETDLLADRVAAETTPDVPVGEAGRETEMTETPNRQSSGRAS